jgi:hypothetical protein
MNLSRLLPILIVSATISASADAQGCIVSTVRGEKNVRHRTSVNDDDGDKRLSVWWQREDCELRVESRGDFTVRPDLSGITGIARGGYVEIEERDRNRERKLRVTDGAAGLVHRWTLDGENGFDVNRERWLADMLAVIERRTALFARSRVPELVRQGGPEAVLNETALMYSDYARRLYFTMLLKTTRVDEAALERMLRQVGDSMSSDHERSQVIRAVSEHGPMNDRVTRAAIGAAHRMSSDYEKRRALSAGLASVATLEARNALFTAASTMSSSYELAELLIAAQQRSLVDSLSRVAYFRAVNRLSSDYEHRRTLSALLKQRPESPSVLADLLKSSEDIDSDHELASLLVEFTRVTAVRGELRELYLKAARSISSDYEYRRALQALLEQDRRT